MENIINEYKLLIDKLHLQKDSFPENDLVIFSPAKGATYNSELMIVGRAVNDWKNFWQKHDETKKTQVINDIIRYLKIDNLEWVEKHWGLNVKDTYNTKKSAFWRVAKNLAIQFADEEKGAINNIAWSNLYKIAKSGGGNPSAKLKSAQFEHCLNILKYEIDLLKPRYIIFLTDYYGWAEPFITRLGITEITKSSASFVRFTGVYNGSNIVVARHPQGKPEDEHVQEILAANETFKVDSNNSKK